MYVTDRQTFSEEIRDILTHIIDNELPPASGLYKIVEDSNYVNLHLIKRTVPFTPLATNIKLCKIRKMPIIIDLQATVYGDNFSQILTQQIRDYTSLNDCGYEINKFPSIVSSEITLCWDKRCVPVNDYQA